MAGYKLNAAEDSAMYDNNLEPYDKMISKIKACIILF